LTLGEFTEETKRKLARVVPDIGAVHNPVDFTAGYIAGGNAENFGTAVQAVLDDPGVDAVCLNFATTAGAACHAGARVLARIASNAGKPIVVFLSTPPSESGDALPVFAEAGIPVFPSPVRAAKAIAMLADYARAQAREAERLTSAFSADEDLGQGFRPALLRNAAGALSEADSKGILGGMGVAVTRDVLVRCIDDVPFDSMTPPFAVKIVSADIAHKTEIGGVKLNVRTRDELSAAIDEVLENARTLAPQARVDGVIVSEMLSGGFELIAGVVNDVIFGPVVVVGAGGIHAEILDDTACRLAPFDERTARDMVDELRCRPVLNGVRGSPGLDLGAIARTLVTLSQFAWRNRDTVAEVDLNPLFALPGGAVAADALIVMRRAK
jgi:acetyltransferase